MGRALARISDYSTINCSNKTNPIQVPTSGALMEPSQPQALDPMQWLSFKRTETIFMVVECCSLDNLQSYSGADWCAVLCGYVMHLDRVMWGDKCTCETTAQKWGKNFLRALIINLFGSEEKLTLTPERKHLTFATFRLHCRSLPQAFCDMTATQEEDYGKVVETLQEL